MTYKGFEIVQQFVGYKFWTLTDDGLMDNCVTDFEDEPDGYTVWDGEQQHKDFFKIWDSIDEVKQAIDEHLLLEEAE